MSGRKEERFFVLFRSAVLIYESIAAAVELGAVGQQLLQLLDDLEPPPETSARPLEGQVDQVVRRAVVPDPSDHLEQDLQEP